MRHFEVVVQVHNLRFYVQAYIMYYRQQDLIMLLTNINTDVLDFKIDLYIWAFLKIADSESFPPTQWETQNFSVEIPIPVQKRNRYSDINTQNV